MVVPKEKRRIRHIYQHNGPEPDWNKNPRGWISPEGRFFETKEHWRSITFQFKRPEIRSQPEITPEELEEAERIAQLAYNLGWISLGHAGEINAVGHQKTFMKTLHPAVSTLRKLLANSHQLSIHVELQIGDFKASHGTHEDFDVREYDLDIFIKRGRLIVCR